VDYATSGNTLELLYELSGDFPVMTVRLAGISAPLQTQEPWGPAAQDCLTEFKRQMVEVEPVGIEVDAYDRLWAYVWAQGDLVNATVLKAGCALLDNEGLAQLRYRESMVYAQEYARLQGLGIWAPEHPLREIVRDLPAHP
jgi:micrococcal nuclease